MISTAILTRVVDFLFILISVISCALIDIRVNAGDLNRLLDDQENAEIEWVLSCIQEGKLINFTGNISVRGEVIYQGIYCGGLYGGYSGWAVLGRLHEVTTADCYYAGTFMDQWSMRNAQDRKGKSIQTLVKLRKYNSCTPRDVSDISVTFNDVEVVEQYYPAAWICIKHSGYDPLRIGRDCSLRQKD